MKNRGRLYKINYTIKHRRAFRKVERELLGCNTFDGLTHDLGKLLLLIFCPFISMNKIKKYHKNTARHHNAVTRMDYIQKIIDYECARYTKPDKPMTAREWVENTKSRYADEEEYKRLTNVLDFLGLTK